MPLEADVETGKGPSCTTSNVMLSSRSSPQPATARAASASLLPQVHGRILTMWHVAVCAELPCSLREHSAYTLLKDGNGQPDEAAIAAAQQKGLLPGNASVGSCMPNACTTWHDCCWALLSTWLPWEDRCFVCCNSCQQLFDGVGVPAPCCLLLQARCAFLSKAPQASPT